MGRILSFLLFGLLLYNMIGYPIVYLLEEKYVATGAGPDYIERSSYSKDIVVKVPVSLPYQVSWSHPEPSEGKIEHKGEYYQIRAKQLVSDTMYVYCEYDQNARDRFAELAEHILDETTRTPSGDHSRLLKNFMKEFMTSSQKHIFFVMEWLETTPSATDQYSDPVSQTSLSTPAPPPEGALLS